MKTSHRFDGWFVMRTPLLPWNEESESSAHLDPYVSSDSSDEATTLQLSRRANDMVEFASLQIVSEALLLCSPTLWRQLQQAGPKEDIAFNLIRYCSRLTMRPTPFATCAGLTLGRIGPETVLRLGAQLNYRRVSRLDSSLLARIAQVQARSDRGAHLPLIANPSTYTFGTELRYYERTEDAAGRTFRLASVRWMAVLDRVLECATTVTLFGTLVSMLEDNGYPPKASVQFIHDLIDADLLRCPLGLRLAADQPPELPEAPASVRSRLDEAATALGALDEFGIGASAASYDRVVRPLADYTEQDRQYVNVDLFKPPDQVTLSSRIADEVLRGIQLLQDIRPHKPSASLLRFRHRFQERYGDEWRPLCEVLDECDGIGFGDGTAALQPDDLLSGISLGVTEQEGEAEVATRLAPLLAPRRGSSIELSVADIRDLSQGTTSAPLPDAFCVVARLLAASDTHIARGNYQLLLEHADGPSGINLIARFTRDHADLAALARRHVRAEEALMPGVVFAEVMHLEQERMGNIVSRACLREYELIINAVPSVDEAHQIFLRDVYVAVVDGEVQLYSYRLGRRIVPRVSAADDHTVARVPAYRFLCALQNQNASCSAWSWGRLDTLPYLPRVSHGRLILSRARWRLSAADLHRLRVAYRRSVSSGLHEFDRLCSSISLPRYVALADGDQHFAGDLADPLWKASLLQRVTARQTAVLVEQLPLPSQLCTHGPEGRFVHELVLPFVRKESPVAPQASPRSVPSECSVLRYFPGSIWAYMKIYCAPESADDVLTHAVAPAMRILNSEKAIDRFFFVRYADPDFHLRVRFRFRAAEGSLQLVKLLTDHLGTLSNPRRVHRVVMDTYEPETGRYGGAVGLEHAEQVFWWDSLCAFELIQAARLGQTPRWRIALRSLSALLKDLGLTSEEQEELARNACDGYAREFEVSRAFRREVGARFRSAWPEGREGSDRLNSGMSTAITDALDERSARCHNVARDVRELERRGELSVPILEFAWSIAHMCLNRLLLDRQREQEYVLLEFFGRLLRSERARSRTM